MTSASRKEMLGMKATMRLAEMIQASDMIGKSNMASDFHSLRRYALTTLYVSE